MIILKKWLHQDCTISTFPQALKLYMGTDCIRTTLLLWLIVYKTFFVLDLLFIILHGGIKPYEYLVTEVRHRWTDVFNGTHFIGVYVALSTNVLVRPVVNYSSRYFLRQIVPFSGYCIGYLTTILMGWVLSWFCGYTIKLGRNLISGCQIKIQK